MSKRFLVRALLVVATGGLVVWIVLKYADSEARLPAITDDDKTKQSAQLFGTAPVTQPAPVVLDMQRPVRLAIGSLGFSDEEQNRRVSDLALAQLAGAKGLEMVERQALDAVLRELSLSAAGLVRAKDAVRVGKLLRADWFLLGSPTSLNGTNYTVVRMVDARTGILREAGVFESGPASSRLASELAGFVRKCRQNAAEAKSRVYLAVGSFEDLSVNNRQAALPTQLRSYLTAAYQRANVTLLEREFASTLLQEVRLDLAGLTEEAATNAPVMQSAYWMVDGFYQSYETTNLQVELVVNVRRMFGRNQQIELRDKPGEPLLKRLKQEIDAVMARNQVDLKLTRMTEMKAVLATGKELAGIGGTDFPNHVWVGYVGYESVSESEMARRVRNAEEAVRAFETVLLLDPTNREARVCLATCFRKTLIRRLDDARDYYRQIIDSPVKDRWSDVARQALLESFRWETPDEKHQWLRSAADRSANPEAAEFYRTQAKVAAEDAAVQEGGSSEAARILEERLVQSIRDWEKEWRGNAIGINFHGIETYAQSFGTNATAAAKRLSDLLPKLQQEAPDLAPYILAGVALFQVDTNSLVIAQFEKDLDENAEHPKKVFRSRSYFALVSSRLSHWAAKVGLFRLAAKTIESRDRAARSGEATPLDAGMKIELAFYYMGAGQWKEALPLLESYSNRPVEMGSTGIWGRALFPVFTSKQVAWCRQKLGLPSVNDPREIDMSKELVCLHEPSAFSVDADGLWFGIGDQLMHLNFDLQTNVTVHLPITGYAPVTCLCLGSSKIWIGTDGEGLVEVDKASRACRRWTEKDGLMMDHITALNLTEDVLWIGYGHQDYGRQNAGGLGRLELAPRRFTSFSRSLLENTSGGNRPPAPQATEKKEQPPRGQVFAMTTGRDDKVWLRSRGNFVRCYHPGDDTWETLENIGGTCLVADAERLFVGQHQRDYTGRGDVARELGVLVMYLRDGKWRSLSAADGLPYSAVTTMTLDGQDLWIGGYGFIALLNGQEGGVRKFAYVCARSVDQIQIGGGYVWVKYDKHLYRASLNDIR